MTFREILRAIDSGTGTGYGDIAGLTYRQGASFVDTPPRPVSALDTDAVRLPDRSARVLPGYTLLGRPVDVVETSRGCTFDCSFCSIIEMRGRNFHRFPLQPRVGRYRRCPRARSGVHLLRRRQHHARHAAVRGAVPGDRGQGVERRRVLRSGHDVVDREARQHNRAADAGRLAFGTCFSGSRTSWTTIWRSCGPPRRTGRGRRAAGARAPRCRQSTTSTATGCMSSAG